MTLTDLIEETETRELEVTDREIRDLREKFRESSGGKADDDAGSQICNRALGYAVNGPIGFLTVTEARAVCMRMVAASPDAKPLR